ncbi:hypothetical protein HanRHA438_Chr13g0598241 [Helianthus annuus]|nr:hypothetical protein HanRHA438_Chr13g0598241 [Helianthus annuus]
MRFDPKSRCVGLQTNQTFGKQFVNRAAGSSFVSVCLLNKRTRTRNFIRLVKRTNMNRGRIRSYMFVNVW